MKKKEVEKQIDFIKDKYYNDKLSMQKIGELIGCSANTIHRVMKENGLKARTDREQALKYYCNENYFDVINTEEKAYWLGFMYADGFIQNKRKYRTNPSTFHKLSINNFIRIQIWSLLCEPYCSRTRC